MNVSNRESKLRDAATSPRSRVQARNSRSMRAGQ